MGREQVTGGEAIVRGLLANGVDTLFGLPGAQLYALFDALHQHQDEIRTFGTRHEQGAGFMAFGAAKSTGRPAVYSVVPGPGVLNTGAALATAWAATAPVLCVTGQIPSGYLGRGRGHLHEIPDQLATLRSLTKWAEHVGSVAETSRLVNEAFRQLGSGRPQPVAIEMCWDVMSGPGDHVPEPAPVPAPPPEPDPDQLAHARRLVAGARRPMIMLGAGAQHAGAEVLALAEMLGAPVTAFRSGRGVVPEDHPLALNSAAARQLWDDTDLLIGVGSRCEMPYMRWGQMLTEPRRPSPGPKLVRIDIDPAEMLRLQPDAALVTDSAAGCALLLEHVKPRFADPDASRQRIAEANIAARDAFQRVQPEVDYLNVIRRVLPRNGFFVEELCQAGFASYYAFPVYEPRTYVTAGFQGTLGFGFPTALGVKAANPDRAVVSIIGDGGFMFGVTEMATAVQHRLGVVTCVFNNNAFYNVQRDQMRRFNGRVIASDLVNPDFVKLAESFGMAGYRVDSPDGLQPVLERALADDAPALIEIVVDKGSEAVPWEFIHR